MQLYALKFTLIKDDPRWEGHQRVEEGKDNFIIVRTLPSEMYLGALVARHSPIYDKLDEFSSHIGRHLQHYNEGDIEIGLDLYGFKDVIKVGILTRNILTPHSKFYEPNSPSSPWFNLQCGDYDIMTAKRLEWNPDERRVFEENIKNALAGK